MVPKPQISASDLGHVVSYDQKDGNIVPEAASRFGVPAQQEISMSIAIGTTATTGLSCPESGVWKVVGSPSTTAPIAKGNRMPPYGGKAVTWRLIAYA